MNKHFDRWMNISLFVSNATAIALIGTGHMFWGAVFGALSEPGFAYLSWKSRSWALAALTAWWAGWYIVVIWHNL